MKNKTDLLNDSITSLFMRFFVTSVAGMIMVSIYILADTIFIGRGIGSEGLAALNIAIPIFNVLFATGLLFGVGGATVLSISLGKEEFNKAKTIFTHSFIVTTLFSAMYTVLGLFFLDNISYFLGATKNNIILVKEYLSVVLMFSFSFVLVYMITVFVRNDKAPKLAMWSTICGGIINIVLDYVFIFVFHWGMRGAAIATVLSSLTSLIILCTHFINKNSFIKLQKIKFEGNLIKRISYNGIPSFIIEISSGVVIFLFNKVLLSYLGEIGVSSYSIIANIALVVIAIFTGIAQAIQPIISINFGANNIDRVYKVRKMSIYSSVIIGSVFFIIGKLFPYEIVSLFVRGNTELINITVNGIGYYFIGFLLVGINIVMSSYFQSMEFSSFSTVISVGRGIGFVLIGLLILPQIFSVDGIWLTTPFAETLTFILVVIFNIIISRKIQGEGENLIEKN